MKTIATRHYIVEYVVPDSPEEKQEIQRIIKEVDEEQETIDLSEYALQMPDDKINFNKNKK
jgi:hypothetical protein